MRRLNADEQAIWARLAQSVRPLQGRYRPAIPPGPAADMRLADNIPGKISGRLADVRSVSRPVIGQTLDGTWDRKLGSGRIEPDRTIDLHGHSLNSAWRALDHGLDKALRDQCRVVLLVTGKARENPRDGENRRGIIRAKIGDWLSASRFAGQIAAIRNAHPRHGGRGALYVILRRRRDA